MVSNHEPEFYEPEQILDALSKMHLVMERTFGKKLMASIIVQLEHLVKLEKEYWSLKESTITVSPHPVCDDEIVDILRRHNLYGTPVLQITRGRACERDLMLKLLDDYEAQKNRSRQMKTMLEAAVSDFEKLYQYAVKFQDDAQSASWFYPVLVEDRRWRFADAVKELVKEV